MRQPIGRLDAARVCSLLCLGLCCCKADAQTGQGLEARSGAELRETAQPNCSAQSGWVLLQTKSNLARVSDKSDVYSEEAVNATAVATLFSGGRHPGDHDTLHVLPPSHHLGHLAGPAHRHHKAEPGDKFSEVGGHSRPAKINHSRKDSTDDLSFQPGGRVRKNSAGDLSALLMSICSSCTGLLLCFLLFHYLRHKYPMIYANNVLLKTAPFDPPSSLLGWWHASMGLKPEQVSRTAGLDQAMLLEFLHMCIWLLAVISVPMTAMCFLHAFFGKTPPVDDGLGRIDFANVGANSWLCWVHAGLVWFVVVMCHRTTGNAHEAFLPRRLRWLKELPEPRSTSILVEGIPESIRTDAQLQTFFEGVFPAKGAILSSTIVKRTVHLASLTERLAVAWESLQSEQFTQQEDATVDWKFEVEMLEQEVHKERSRVQSAAAAGDAGIHSATGFVTFQDRRDKETALCLKYTRNDGELLVSMPPDPSDIYYADLQADPKERRYWRLVGDMLMVLVFVTFLPVVVCISAIIRLQTLEAHIPIFRYVVEGWPLLKSAWDGMMGSTIISCMTGFVPGLFISIFQWYSLKTGQRVQLHVQAWYFYFLVVFVLFVTALGNSLLDAVFYLVATPHSLIYRLARTLPMASHFYLNYLVVQTLSYGLCLLRLVPLLRFISWQKVCDDEEARKLADPGETDSIGARSATFSFHLVVALVFSSITPLICVVALISFIFARAFYGYLIVFVEPAMPDLGGKFWYEQLRQMQQGLFIYIVLMSAIVAHKSSSWLPSLIAFSSLLFHVQKYMEFQRSYRHWDHLPVEEISRDSPPKAARPSGTYVQPELQERLFRT